MAGLKFWDGTTFQELKGATGATGPQGAVGPTGSTGPQGVIGPQGPIGPTGATGAPGATGMPGTAGAVGGVGPQGPIGPTGATGATGSTGAPSSVAGPTGPQVAVGPQGVAGPQGTIGPTGATGATGAPGADGAGAVSSVADTASIDLTLASGVLSAAALFGTTTGKVADGGTLATHAAATAAHGAAGAVVGTTNTQTLTNKTLTAPAISAPTGLVKADVGLSNVDNTADTAKALAASQITSGVISPARLGTGTADATTVLYGDGTFKTAASGGGSTPPSFQMFSAAATAAASSTTYVTVDTYTITGLIIGKTYDIDFTGFLSATGNGSTMVGAARVTVAGNLAASTRSQASGTSGASTSVPLFGYVAGFVATGTSTTILIEMTRAAGSGAQTASWCQGLARVFQRP